MTDNKIGIKRVIRLYEDMVQADPQDEYAQIVLAALREKAEREKGCDCWDNVQRQAWLETGATYCQQCGKKLEVK